MASGRGTRDHGVELIAVIGGETVPFEVKYRSQHTGVGKLKGLAEFREINRLTAITSPQKNFCVILRC